MKGMLPKGRIASPLFNHLKARASEGARGPGGRGLGCSCAAVAPLQPCCARALPGWRCRGASFPSAARLRPDSLSRATDSLSSTHPPAPQHPSHPPAPAQQVYKGTAHPHEAQRPIDITSRISKKPSEAL